MAKHRPTDHCTILTGFLLHLSQILPLLSIHSYSHLLFLLEIVYLPRRTTIAHIGFRWTGIATIGSSFFFLGCRLGDRMLVQYTSGVGTAALTSDHVKEEYTSYAEVSLSTAATFVFDAFIIYYISTIKMDCHHHHFRIASSFKEHRTTYGGLKGDYIEKTWERQFYHEDTHYST
ncbi:hypothetical protein C5167_035519 [Papaver somniferum]|uniref:Uncharacterized protein n=1 Tax=Papaver somniferum TaxID=3469 RepID=A0A4Y7KJK0_PAPSO|nr:hypothetical protein C5167_035519 [Papaver somniferum]